MEIERFDHQNVEMTASSSNMLQFQGKRAEEHIQKKTEKNIIPKTIPDPFLYSELSQLHHFCSSKVAWWSLSLAQDVEKETAEATGGASSAAGASGAADSGGGASSAEQEETGEISPRELS